MKRQFFDESNPASEEIFWIAKALLDEQDFGLVAKPYCRCRFDRSVDTEERAAPLLYSLDTLNYAKEKFGEIPLWAQYAVMLNLSGQIREGDRNTLSLSQKEAYQDLMRGCLEQIDDRIICAARNLWPEERLLALASKYGMTYEQVKELVTADENTQALWWRWTDAEPPVLFFKRDRLRVEFMDIAKTHLHVRGSCAVLVGSSERIRLVVTAVWEDGSVREYPCELIRRPDLKRRRLAFPDELWPREGFELFLPLADFVGKVDIRAFVDIDGRQHFDLEWLHQNQSPFAQGDEKLFWERAGYTVRQLPDNAGLRVESWGGGGNFLFSFIIPAYNVKPYLAEAVESVLAQTVGFEENIQIVLVNDGSTDGTGAVCKRYRNLWPDNIVYIEKPNGGVSSARNAGLKAATGRYINFLDADDKWDPDVCQAALDFFAAHPEVKIVCFPILFFDRREDAHWLNYKFKQTKVANIFKDTDYATFSVANCILKSESAKNNESFDESLSIAEDSKWIAKFLLDNQNFGIISNQYYRYRKRFEQNSTLDSNNLNNLSRYIDTPRFHYLERFSYAQDKYGTIPRWMQYTVMMDITWRIKQKDDGFLTPDQKQEYRSLMQSCLVQIDDQIIYTVRNLWPEERMCAFALKYGTSYEQVKEWVKADEKEQALCLCRSGSAPVPFTKPWNVRVEFMEIADGQLLLRGSCSALVSRERMACTLEIEVPDGNRQEYPCELFRRPDRKKQPFFEDDLWALESFEVSVPLADGIRVRAFFTIDSIRFELKWQHEKLSPFVRGNEASYLARAGYIVSKLPDDKGLFVESWTSQRAQEREETFLRWVARQKPETPAMLVARIRKAARRMRRLSRKPIWLISDRILFADDSGEVLFTYLMANLEERQGVRPVFVLSKDSADWDRLKQIGPTVADGSILHKILFLAADKIISSSADNCTINPFVKDDWLYRDLFNFDFVFLQHGVIKDDLSRWLYKSNKNIALFVTSAERERQSIVEGEYGYTPDQVVLTGLPRFDKLLRKAVVEKTQRLVAVMPTWRKYLDLFRNDQTDSSTPNPNFAQSEYFLFWNSLINHPHLLDALRQRGYHLHFACHPRFRHEADKFQVQKPVEVVPHCDYPQTFCEAAVLLTDYSSTACDFALLHKPLIYAQFDAKEFFSGKHSYDKGYFDYERDGFGPVCVDLETTVDAVIHYLENGCEMEPLYRERVDAFFGRQPENRCQAVVESVKKLGRRAE